MASNMGVTVFGAYGHTGRFVVSELRHRGYTPILSGRDPDKLNALGDVHPGLELRPASVDDPASLDRALAGSTAVINCAGPFARAAAPVMQPGPDGVARRNAQAAFKRDVIPLGLAHRFYHPTRAPDAFRSRVWRQKTKPNHSLNLSLNLC